MSLPAPRVRLLGDRILLTTEGEDGERRSGSGIVIPATASMGRRLACGDRVLFAPEDRAEVEVESRTYVLLRERDLHGVSETPSSDQHTGLYL